MMSSSEGAKFLSTEDLLLKQLTKSFAQLDPVRIVIFGLVFFKKLKLVFRSSMALLQRTLSSLSRDSATLLLLDI